MKRLSATGAGGRRLPRWSLLLLLTVLSAPAFQAKAAPLLVYDFDDGAGGFANAPSLVAPGLTAGPWSVDLGSVGHVAGNPGRAISGTQWLTGNAFRFSLAPTTDQILVLTGFSFDQQASGTGPTGWLLYLAETLIGSGGTSTSFQLQQALLANLLVHGPVEISLAAGGAGSNAGTWRIDNFRLEGHWAAAVPEPRAGLLLGIGLAMLCWRTIIGRRRSLSKRPAPAPAG